MTADNYFLTALLGQVSAEREDAARTLVRIFESRNVVMDFMKACVDHEINSTNDYNTLFRANSMASKVIDVYLRTVGRKFLETVRGETVRSIITSKKSCEVGRCSVKLSFVFKRPHDCG